jgi:hypothetical protein
MSEHTPTPWNLCHHLESAEKDASCQCGYRGGIWGNKGELLVCEMRNCDLHEGHDMIRVGSRAEQLANAAFIVKAVNNYEALVRHLHHLAAVCCDEDALRLLDSLRDEQAAHLSQKRNP